MLPIITNIILVQMNELNSCIYVMYHILEVEMNCVLHQLSPLFSFDIYAKVTINSSFIKG